MVAQTLRILSRRPLILSAHLARNTVAQGVRNLEDKVHSAARRKLTSTDRAALCLAARAALSLEARAAWSLAAAR